MLADLRAQFLPEFLTETRTRLRHAMSLLPPAGPATEQGAQQIAAMMHSITGEALLIGAPELALLARAAAGAARRYLETHHDAALVACARTLRSFLRELEKLALPAASVPESAASPRERPGRERARILVVDDSPLNAALLRELLISEGFDATSVGDDMDQVLLRLTSFRPHVLLVDWIMPGCDTRILCRRIQSTPALSHLRILLISSLPASEAEDQARRLGIAGALSKEQGMQAIVSRIRAVAEDAR
jgi:PleD family two-component response regulator